jgi:hypothetical protein
MNERTCVVTRQSVSSEEPFSFSMDNGRRTFAIVPTRLVLSSAGFVNTVAFSFVQVLRTRVAYARRKYKLSSGMYINTISSCTWCISSNDASQSGIEKRPHRAVNTKTTTPVPPVWKNRRKSFRNGYVPKLQRL